MEKKAWWQPPIFISCLLIGQKGFNLLFSKALWLSGIINSKVYLSLVIWCLDLSKSCSRSIILFLSWVISLVWLSLPTREKSEISIDIHKCSKSVIIYMSFIDQGRILAPYCPIPTFLCGFSDVLRYMTAQWFLNELW